MISIKPKKKDEYGGSTCARPRSMLSPFCALDQTSMLSHHGQNHHVSGLPFCCRHLRWPGHHLLRKMGSKARAPGQTRCHWHLPQEVRNGAWCPQWFSQAHPQQFSPTGRRNPHGEWPERTQMPYPAPWSTMDCSLLLPSPSHQFSSRSNLFFTEEKDWSNGFPKLPKTSQVTHKCKTGTFTEFTQVALGCQISAITVTN